MASKWDNQNVITSFCEELTPGTGVFEHGSTLHIKTAVHTRATASSTGPPLMARS